MFCLPEHHLTHKHPMFYIPPQPVTQLWAHLMQKWMHFNCGTGTTPQAFCEINLVHLRSKEAQILG